MSGNAGEARPPAPRRLGVSGGLLVATGAVLLAVSATCLSIHWRNDRYLLAATAFIFDRPGTAEQKAIALARFVTQQSNQPVDPDSASFEAKFEHHLPLEISPVTVLKEGFAFPDARRFGPCGQLSRTIRAVASLRHIPSHKVLLGVGPGEHAMVALYVDGAYRLFDPTYDFYWTNRSGHVASIDEVRGDTAIFAQVFRKVPDYKYRLDDATYFRWNRLGAPGRWLRRALEAIAGPKWVREVDTPMLYERPWLGYAFVSLLAGLGCLALAAVRFVRR